MIRLPAFVVGLTVSVVAVVASAGDLAPRRDCRLMMNWDQQSMWCLQLAYALRGETPDPEIVKARLESVIDEHAKAGVDRIVHCVFALAEGTVPPDMKSFYRRKWTGIFAGEDTGIVTMEQAGYDLVQVMLERTRSQGMQFLAGLRMNDRHGDPWATPFGQEHPEWRLREQNIRGFDYRAAGVREAMLEVAREVLNRYDVDGLELDWMRHCHVFNPSEAPQSAPILTDFVKQMRAVVNQAAQRRGKDKLLLGVRVAQTVEECQSLGYDVRAWVQDGLVDFICPSDFFYNDFNVRTDEFVTLVRGTSCKVYPSIHPKMAEGHFNDVPTAANYNAAARNFLAYGADGVSVYNYHYHWRADMGSESDWPAAMSYLTPLRDMASVSRGPRHYQFYPLWPPGKCPTGAQFDKTNTIVLRAKQPTGSVRFRLAEDLADRSLRAQLRFKVLGDVEADRLQVSINGHVLPATTLERKPVPGRAEEDGRPLPPFLYYSAPLDATLARWGDNDLQLAWDPSPDSAGEAELLAQEFEVIVDFK